MKTLLIWEENPECIRFFLFDPTENQLKVLEKANGHLENNTDDGEAIEAINKISEAICDRSDILSGEYPELEQIWAKNEVKTPIKEKIECVYTTGFMM